MPISTAQALQATLISPNECDACGEAANVVDGLFAIARALDRIATALEQIAPSVRNYRLKTEGETNDARATART